MMQLHLLASSAPHTRRPSPRSHQDHLCGHAQHVWQDGGLTQRQRPRQQQHPGAFIQHKAPQGGKPCRQEGQVQGGAGVWDRVGFMEGGGGRRRCWRGTRRHREGHCKRSVRPTARRGSSPASLALRRQHWQQDSPAQAQFFLLLTRDRAVETRACSVGAMQTSLCSRPKGASSVRSSGGAASATRQPRSRCSCRPSATRGCTSPRCLPKVAIRRLCCPLPGAMAAAGGGGRAAGRRPGGAAELSGGALGRGALCDFEALHAASNAKDATARSKEAAWGDRGKGSALLAALLQLWIEGSERGARD